jgi:CheY-like chemotaxis protein
MAHLVPVILIVEDEFLLRLDSAETIEHAGFEVIQAANADEAIAILNARLDIHVVFTDIQMPGSMDGLKLARFVRNRWPPIKIVATSGRVVVGFCRPGACSCQSRIVVPRWSRRCAS